MSNNFGHGTISRRSLLRRGGQAVAGLAVVTAASGCTWLDATDDDRYMVEITNQARFEPSGLTVPVGATVVWRNMDDRPHTVTTDPDVLPDPTRVSLPDGAEPWDSGEISTGERWTYTFEVPGTYLYACRYHQADGMVGTITVEGGDS
jgi:plastocyanin